MGRPDPRDVKKQKMRAKLHQGPDSGLARTILHKQVHPAGAHLPGTGAADDAPGVTRVMSTRQVARKHPDKTKGLQRPSGRAFKKAPLAARVALKSDPAPASTNSPEPPMDKTRKTSLKALIRAGLPGRVLSNPNERTLSGRPVKPSRHTLRLDPVARKLADKQAERKAAQARILDKETKKAKKKKSKVSA